MTLENCKKLLKHYENIIDGTTPAPIGHKNWDKVKLNAKVQVEELKRRIAWKESDEFKAQQKARGNPKFIDWEPKKAKKEVNNSDGA